MINTTTHTDGSDPSASNRSVIDFFGSSSAKLSRQLASKGLNMALKQHATTPAIQKLCRFLDEDLNRLLNDIEFSTSMSNSATLPDTNILNDDFKYFNEYLQANLELFNDNLCKSLTNLIESLKKEQDENKNEQNINMKKSY